MEKNYKNKLELLINEIKYMGVNNEVIFNAMRAIPRHEFVPKDKIKEAYINYPLHIGQDQTISQPYTVVFMLNVLDLKKRYKVLEIGSGSGWNAALIGDIIKPGRVYSIEIIKELYEFALNNIKKFKLNNVKIIHGDGSQGYSKNAPYDRIILTASCPFIPKPLLEQLKINGILVAPVGPSFSQDMVKITKISENDYKEERLGGFIFVPLKGKFGYG